MRHHGGRWSSLRPINDAAAVARCEPLTRERVDLRSRRSDLAPAGLLVTSIVAMSMLALSALPAAGAALVPVAVTSSASAIGSSSAVLSGSVDPNGTATNWYIQYGKTTSYGLKTPTLSAGAGRAAIVVSTSVSGLLPSTTYHFRLVATSIAGTGVGADTAFMTKLVAPSVSTLLATAVSAGTATLHGSVNPNGQATVAHYVYGTTTAYGFSTASISMGAATTASTFPVAVSGLTEDTTYHFRLIATNPVGSTTGADESFITSGLPAAINGPVTGISTSGVILSGLVNPGGHAVSWYFEYGATTAYGAKTSMRSIAAGSANIPISTALTGLASSTIYHFRLLAINSRGTVASPDAVFTTLGPTLALAPTTVVYGGATALTGVVPNYGVNEDVAVFAKSISASSFVQIATILTGTGGAWSYRVAPSIQTTYEVVFGRDVSPPATVLVQPALRFRAIAHAGFAASVREAGTLNGHLV